MESGRDRQRGGAAGGRIGDTKLAFALKRQSSVTGFSQVASSGATAYRLLPPHHSLAAAARAARRSSSPLVSSAKKPAAVDVHHVDHRTLKGMMIGAHDALMAASSVAGGRPAG